jgi:hypothetical protein
MGLPWLDSYALNLPVIRLTFDTGTGRAPPLAYGEHGIILLVFVFFCLQECAGFYFSNALHGLITTYQYRPVVIMAFICER